MINHPMSKKNYKKYPNKDGHFDQYGGMFVSETLMHPLNQLLAAYKKIGKSSSFQKKLKSEL